MKMKLKYNQNRNQIVLRAVNMMKKFNLSVCNILPKRVIMGIMGFFAIAVSYTVRQAFSVAITVISPTDDENEHANIGPTFKWSSTERGWALAAFYIGYVISHVPGGLIAQKFGSKWTISLGVLLMGVLNALTPLAIEYGGLIALIFIRIVMGLGGGTTYPALTVMLAAWVPEKERGKLGSVVFGGGQIGSLLSFYLSGLMLNAYKWNIMFYFWSIIVIVWFIIFTLTCYSDPDSHPYITQAELNYLKTEMGQVKRNSNLPKTPWGNILTSIPVIALVIAQLGHDWILYIISADLPTYLKRVLKLNVDDVGLYTALPFLGMWLFSIFSGFLSDFLIERQIFTITQARKIFTFFGSVPPAIFILAASYAEYNVPLVVGMFVLAMSFLGNFYPGLKVNSLDLSPNYAGALMALTNGVGGLAGVAVPPFIGWMVPNDSSIVQWRVIFWLTFGLSIVRIVVFTFFGSAEVQSWNNPQKCTTSDISLSIQNMKIK